ncbi:MAG: hypothetical protein ISS94_05395 [Candidatus Syntrophoarchaeum sp.]|nr:hypothetical protein [Methanomicrobia archaeon]MBL7118199.1 hypothetical protein [Candidatus Syntrophoarchaeum sp.]
MKKIIRVREFIETAFCPECNSNNVVFDITPDALIKAIRKINKIKQNEKKKH